MIDASMFIGTAWSLIPPILAIFLALVTKEVYSSLFIGITVGALLYTGFHPWNFIVELFGIMRDSMSVDILIFDVLLGMIIVLMAKSGGSSAYGKWASNKFNTKKSASLATMGLGILIFVDDYFNCLTVGNVMRPVTDRNKLSRSKLAYIIDATAAPVCIIAPISSWAAAVNGYVPEDAGISGFQLFCSTIPFNLYALLTLVMVFIMIMWGKDFGQMGVHEANAEKGDLFTSGAEEFADNKDDVVNTKGGVMDLVLPVVVLIASAIFGMIYTGFQNGGVDLIDAFANCSSVTSLIFATFVTVIFCAILYLPRKVITFKEFMECFPEGFKLMVPACAILVLAWTLQGVGAALGIGDFVAGIVNANSSANFILPAIVFLVAIFLAFCTGTSWGTFGILVPIVVEVFSKVNNVDMMIISVAAVLAGAVCGDHISPISDTTIMSSSGAQCNHINHVSTQMQYAFVVVGACIPGYLVAGLTKSWIAALAVGLVVLVGALFVLTKKDAKNA